MNSHPRPPSGLRAVIIGWRAQRVTDPVARLRYLKRTANRTAGKMSLKKKGLLAAAALAVMVAIPYQASWSVSGGEPRVFLRAETLPAEERPPVVWLVEKKQDVEVYSNGLRIESRYVVSNEPRSYLVFGRRLQASEARGGDKPVGIVYHTTESQLAPFEQDHNRRLRRIGVSLVEYVRVNRSYHFVIDRFGRAWRVVAESDAANHAGYSVWADGDLLYINLNRSFLGISFEAQTAAGTGEEKVTEAQIHTARVLTDMLRSRYSIPMRNCVTHAQVSVNPGNMRIGYHTDWADDFPFAQLGLPDNYLRPVPALWACGFTYDPVYVKSTGERLWQGLARAEEVLRQEAAANGMGVARHRQALQKRYKAILELLKDRNEETEERDDHEEQRERTAGHRP